MNEPNYTPPAQSYSCRSDRLQDFETLPGPPGCHSISEATVRRSEAWIWGGPRGVVHEPYTRRRRRWRGRRVRRGGAGRACLRRSQRRPPSRLDRSRLDPPLGTRMAVRPLGLPPWGRPRACRGPAIQRRSPRVPAPRPRRSAESGSRDRPSGILPGAGDGPYTRKALPGVFLSLDGQDAGTIDCRQTRVGARTWSMRTSNRSRSRRSTQVLRQPVRPRSAARHEATETLMSGLGVPAERTSPAG